MKNTHKKLNRIVSFLACAVVVATQFSSCAWPRRKPLVIGSVKKDLQKYSNGILVIFADVIPGKPLNETVWDSARGPFWDVKEAGQIGFNQKYKAPMLAVPPVLLPSAAKSGVPLVDTLIVIPFGNIFAGVFESALEKSFSRHVICFDNNCVSENRGKFSTYAMRIRVTDFFVWEEPLNHINFYVKGNSEPLDLNALDIMKYEFEEELMNYELGGVLSTHSRFIDQMNNVSNQLAEKITLKIMSHGFVKK